MTWPCFLPSNRLALACSQGCGHRTLKSSKSNSVQALIHKQCLGHCITMANVPGANTSHVTKSICREWSNRLSLAFHFLNHKEECIGREDKKWSHFIVNTLRIREVEQLV